MTTEDPRPETPEPDEPTVSSVAGSTSDAGDGAAETAAGADETASAAGETAAGADETAAAADATQAAAEETAAAAATTGAAVDETEAAAAAAAGAVVFSPAAPPAEVPAPPSAWAPPPPARPRYPIDVRFDRDQHIGRFWAIPIIGWFFRWLVLIPHFILLGLFSIVVFIALLVVWIPVLLTGRFPGWGYSIIGGFYRWYIRVAAYLLLLAGPYPPFSATAPYPVEVDFDPDTRLNNLWGIPLVGIYVRSLLRHPAPDRPVAARDRGLPVRLRRLDPGPRERPVSAARLRHRRRVLPLVHAGHRLGLPDGWPVSAVPSRRLAIASPPHRRVSSPR